MRLLGFVAFLAGIVALALAYLASFAGYFAGGVVVLLLSGACFWASGFLWERTRRGQAQRGR